MIRDCRDTYLSFSAAEKRSLQCDLRTILLMRIVGTLSWDLISQVLCLELFGFSLYSSYTCLTSIAISGGNLVFDQIVNFISFVINIRQ